MSRIKVLSIDFDFFQNVKNETINKYYPDGIDVSTKLSEIIWSTKYYDGGLYNEVGIRKCEIEKIKSILLRQKTGTPIMVTNSHMHIYNFIHMNASTKEKLCVVNVDMHHDIFNDNCNLDCGNWLRFIKEEYESKICWICNPVSKKIYGFNERDALNKEKTLEEILPENLDFIKDVDFDIIFLCRSDNWSPPHLDNYFTEICDVISGHFQNAWFEKGINEKRNINKFNVKTIGGYYD